jgi:hypothetical protein
MCVCCGAGDGTQELVLARQELSPPFFFSCSKRTSAMREPLPKALPMAMAEVQESKSNHFSTFTCQFYLTSVNMPLSKVRLTEPKVKEWVRISCP